jgi:hypothetical protein
LSLRGTVTIRPFPLDDVRCVAGDDRGGGLEAAEVLAATARVPMPSAESFPDAAPT